MRTQRLRRVILTNSALTHLLIFSAVKKLKIYDPTSNYMILAAWFIYFANFFPAPQNIN